jgi:copper(I)-binding protein
MKDAKPAAMHNLRIQVFTAIALSIAAIFTFAKGAIAGDISVTNAVAAKSLMAQARTGAIYLSVTNRGPTPDALVGLETDRAEFAELHESLNENNVMQMRAVERLELAPGQMTDLGAMHMHIMLVGLKAPLKPGESVKLRLIFETSDPLEIDVPVGDAPAH